MPNLTEIEGIGASYAEKLKAAGVRNIAGLLEKGCSAKGRKQLADTTGLSASQILKWVNCADLFRIKGIGQEYADLLEASGVDSVPELAQRKAENLHVKMAEVNERKKLVRQLPTMDRVQDWIAQAKNLPKLVMH
ncbi:ferredoxin [Desulfuromonas versatilis]|uniref:Ferredoxin n=1 Tax=Desulfuromonas versatilis TaxID=2802975 RepID=A0ABM8HTI3_9BACT|nr:DUF4332 domain-containing protein [Desulfuromonas versatilis]BCR05633.1 ferredoxin [Desulfuromonas versatilis]